MKIIDRYIGKTIINALLMVLLMLVGVSLFISFIKQFNAFGPGNHNIISIIEYVFLDLPQQIYSLFPVASLVGVMLGLSILANHSELTVFRASGISLNQIVFAVLKASILILIIATLVGEWLAPIAERTATARKINLTTDGQSLLTRAGAWIKDGKYFIHIHMIINNNRLEGVTRYQLNEQNKLVTVDFAKIGTYSHRRWLMQEVVSSKIDSAQVTAEHYPTAYWDLSINPNLLRIAVIDPADMSMIQLYSYIRYLKSNHLNTNDWSLSFWQRLFQPLATLVMMLLAIPFVFGTLRSMTLGVRLVLGITIGFAFSLINQFFGPLSVVYQWPPFLAAALPTLLFALIAYWLLKRAS